MRLKFVDGVRALCIAAGLMLASAEAAQPRHPLMGASRDQLLAQYGEPKSQIVAGNREVIFFARERFVLRDGVVVEIEPLPAEAPRTPPPPPTPTTGTSGAAGADTTTTPEPAAPSADAGTAPVPPTARKGSPAVPPPPPPPTGVEIKSVRPATAGGVRPPASPPPPAPAPSTTAPADAAKAPPATATPAARPTTGATTSAPRPSATPQPASSGAAPRSATTGATAPAAAAGTETGTAGAEVPPADATQTADEAKNDEVEDTKKKAAKARRRHLEGIDTSEPEVSLFSGKTYAIALITIFGGAAYLFWRYRQRQLELAATAVSRTPFAAPAASSGGGTRFTADLLAKLEWKRFEELVASYYGKTGVVAVRTKSGPASPVHIKISWKGEPRPFAYVQCIAHPAGLIEVKPLQELVAALQADDIRRGYAVSTGKFNVPARDLAEEKHITLMPGDIFLEKLNALPDAARAELMQEVTAGDYTTPTCPKCDVKMIRSPENPMQWRCPNHPRCDAVMPVRE